MRWNGVDVTIVGITAKGFRGTTESAPDLWAPIAAFPRLMGASTPEMEAASPVSAIGRIAAGVTTLQAEAQLNAAVASLPPPSVQTAIASLPGACTWIRRRARCRGRSVEQSSPRSRS